MTNNEPVENHIARGETKGLVATLAATFAVMILILHFFSQSIPFYFEDVQYIRASCEQSYPHIVTDILNPFSAESDFGFSDRPVETLVLKVMHDIFGYSPPAYHWFKNLCLLAVAGIAMMWVWLITRRRLFVALTGIWIVAANPVYQSTLWICDFEIVSQLFVILAMFLWFRILSSPDRKLTNLIPISACIILLAYLGSKTKGSSLIIPVAIALSSIPFWRKKFALAIGISALLALVAIVPRCLAANHAIAGGIRWQNLSALSALVQTFLDSTFLLGGLFLCLGAAFLSRRFGPGPAPVAAPESSEGCSNHETAVSVVVAWLISIVFLWLILPNSETRYLAGLVIPATIFVVVVFNCVLEMATGRLAGTAISIMTGATLTWVVLVNLTLDLHFRGFWGSHFIAIDRAVRYVDATYDHSLTLYEYWRPMFFSSNPERGNVFRVAPPGSLGNTVAPDGVLRRRTDFKQVFLVSLVQPDPPIRNATDLMLISGDGFGWFERFIAATHIKIKRFDMMSMSTHEVDKTYYPCKAFIGSLRPTATNAPAASPPTAAN
jgi:hypothetical protein